MNIGLAVLERIVALKAMRGKITEHEFWERYRILRSCFYASPEWIELSLSVRTEQPWCTRGKHHRTQLHAHHKIHLFNDPMQGLVRSNLEVICKRCHKKEH